MPPIIHPYVRGHDTAPALAVGPLLVATTGANATAIITAARLLAGRLGGAPEVVAVREPVPIYLPGMGMEPILPAVDAEQRRRLMDGVTDALGSAYDGDPSWSVDVVDGTPARTIARLARERGSRLIVMGIGRHAPIDRVFGSETALQTIRVADRPVLAVAPGFVELPRHAVVAIDFSPASVRAAEEALSILAEGGKLSLVYVRPRDTDLVRLGSEILNWYDGERVTGLFDRLVASLQVPSSVTLERAVLTGEPADQVLGYADREGADLVATGSSGLGFFDRLIVGSVATRILRRSTVSLLVVPRPSAAEAERIERRLSGTIESSTAARWPDLVEAFSERNIGRPTQLEIDDPSLGAQLQEVGHTLLGVAYDRRHDRLEIMLGAPAGGGRLTHSIGDVTSVGVLSGPHERDLALQARHGQGQTILMFLD
ncbi:MAG TPA: universal stress protein [Gemmatimonadales bacterium]